MFTKGTAPPPAVPMPEPDRNPSSEPSFRDRRKISDELDAAYDVERGRYHGAGTDQVVADKLSMPAAWVRIVREFAFGMNAGSEATAKRDAERSAFAGRLDRFEADMLALMERHDALRKDFRALSEPEVPK